MLRLILSIIILAVIITLLLIPVMKVIRKAAKNQGEFIDEQFTGDVSKKKDDVT